MDYLRDILEVFPALEDLVWIYSPYLIGIGMLVLGLPVIGYSFRKGVKFEEPSKNTRVLIGGILSIGGIMVLYTTNQASKEECMFIYQLDLGVKSVLLLVLGLSLIFISIFTFFFKEKYFPNHFLHKPELIVLFLAGVVLIASCLPIGIYKQFKPLDRAELQIKLNELANSKGNKKLREQIDSSFINVSGNFKLKRDIKIKNLQEERISSFLDRLENSIYTDSIEIRTLRYNNEYCKYEDLTFFMEIKSEVEISLNILAKSKYKQNQSFLEQMRFFEEQCEFIEYFPNLRKRQIKFRETMQFLTLLNSREFKGVKVIDYSISPTSGKITNLSYSI
ncbi:MAG: hypothetical protein MRY78_11525 [Saprospiraceae bacterium]|nr:hypothetical protein [Saprospiraceae bacterium]